MGNPWYETYVQLLRWGNIEKHATENRMKKVKNYIEKFLVAYIRFFLLPKRQMHSQIIKNIAHDRTHSTKCFQRNKNHQKL